MSISYQYHPITLKGFGAVLVQRETGAKDAVKFLSLDEAVELGKVYMDEAITLRLEATQMARDGHLIEADQHMARASSCFAEAYQIRRVAIQAAALAA